MNRFALVGLIALATAGCSSSDDNSASNSANGNPNSTANSNANSAANSASRPVLDESPDCFVRPSIVFRPEETDYVVATEAVLTPIREDYGRWCGSAMSVQINWASVFSSRGFDAGELDEPGAVSTGFKPFFNGGQTFCEGEDTGAIYRAKVMKVVLTATDTDDRVGLCFDETEGALVHRIKLNADDATATYWDASQVGEWLGAEL